MVDSVAAIVGELKDLRKGRALFARRIGDRVGPALQEICGVAEGDSPADIRRKIADRIRDLASGLPDDLRIAVLAAFAVHDQARQPFFQDRVRWVAAQLGRDDRTVRRRIDDGIERLAELATSATPPGQPKGSAWHTEEVRAAVVLDQAAPEVFEFRRIVADQSDLDELDLALTLAVPPELRQLARSRALEVDVFYGGTLVRRAMESSQRFAFFLALPRPLARSEQHEYALRYRVPGGQPMAPHYACVLRQRCDSFELHVRFGMQNPPRRVWRLDGVFQRDLDDPIQRGDPVLPDAAGEICLTFRWLSPGLAYGARWEYAGDAAVRQMTQQSIR